MKSLDTNVLLRFLIADDPVQTARARALIVAERERNAPLYLSLPVVLECVWVLESCYGFERAALVGILRDIVAVRQFEIQERGAVALALEDFFERKGDFADCLIGRLSRLAGAETTLTFDRDLRRNPAFTLV